MPRTEVVAHEKSSKKGTSARTRPFSYDEIMLRRSKKLAEVPKEGIQVSALPGKANTKGDSRSDSDESFKKRKNSNDVEKGSSKRTEGKDKARHDLEANNTKTSSRHIKSSRDKEHTYVKPIYQKSSGSDRLGADDRRDHERKVSEGVVGKKSHKNKDDYQWDHETKGSERLVERNRHKDRDVYQRDHEQRESEGVMEKSRHKDRDDYRRDHKKKWPEGVVEKNSHKDRDDYRRDHEKKWPEGAVEKNSHKDRDDYRRDHEKKWPEGVVEKNSRKDGDDYRRDHEKEVSEGAVEKKGLGDYRKDHEKKGSKGVAEKNNHEDGDTNSRMEKRKHPSQFDEKGRSEYDNYISKKHDLGRGDQKKEYAQPYHDDRRSKRRKSRSPAYDRERDRSVSLSPRTQKRSYHGRDHGDSPYHTQRDKSRRKFMDTDNFRADNGGYSSDHHWKNGSGLGGYSPRKRKTEAAVKTPSPTLRSPERKSSTWDQPPSGTNNTVSVSVLANLQSPATKLPEVVSSVLDTPATTIPQPVSPIYNPKILVKPSIDSVQLTQATRPMRRIHIENLPPSVSDKTVIDCLNDFLMLPGVGNIQRIKPCINCIINKEKSQALVEFLTPEDATKALSFDGRSLSGSVLQIRRPKDFIEAATGAPEKPVAATKAICDVVRDTHHKIFVGGISKSLSSDMLLEIVSAFGLLRAYHYQFDVEHNASIAFLEYADHSVTLKACAGLNGIKLGGNVLTVVHAFPSDHGEKEVTCADVSYVVPEHAKPLLAVPTKVLQLKNVFNQDELMLLSEAEVAEVVEDIRLECARFGIIKSVNATRHDKNCGTATKAVEQNITPKSCKMEAGVAIATLGSIQSGDLPLPTDYLKEIENVKREEVMEELQNVKKAEVVKELQNVEKEEAVNDPQENEATDLLPAGDTTVCEESLIIADASGDSPVQFKKDSGLDSERFSVEKGLAYEMPELQPDVKLSRDDESNLGTESEIREDSEGILDENMNINTSSADNAVVSNVAANGQYNDPCVFEPGCVLVEFTRAEAARLAAHYLHGRSFGEQIVTAGYVPHDVYIARFRR